mgnify:CR=1 FL=1
MLLYSNFEAKGTERSTYMMSFDYAQDLEKLNVKFYDEKTDMNKVIYCEHSLKDNLTAKDYKIIYASIKL